MAEHLLVIQLANPLVYETEQNGTRRGARMRCGKLFSHVPLFYSLKIGTDVFWATLYRIKVAV